MAYISQEFEDMLYLFGMGATGKNVAVSNHKYNVDKIFEYAAKQGILPLIYSSLKNDFDTTRYKDIFVSCVLKSILRRNFTLSILDGMEKINVKYAMIKGETVSVFYKDADYRISSDTDILIDFKDERKVYEYLKSNGYDVKKRRKNDHHFKAYHSVGGLLEIHVKLYGKLREKLFFDGDYHLNEDFIHINICNRQIYTLGINDGLFYLTYHYIKHFINEGGGVRQMMDLLLYMEHYKDEIDHKTYERILKELKYDKLIDTVKTIGAKYWGMDYPIKYEDLADKLLADSEKGGIFGYSADDRRGFYSVYCKKRHSKLFATFVMNYYSESGILAKLFPTRETMKILGYKNTDRATGLCIAWFIRLFKKAFVKDKKKEQEQRGIKDRMDMMDELGMF